MAIDEVDHVGPAPLYLGFCLLVVLLLRDPPRVPEADIGVGVLGAIVMLVGVEMLVMDWYRIPVPWMLAMVAVVLAVSIAASLLTRRPGTTAGARADGGQG